MYLFKSNNCIGMAKKLIRYFNQILLQLLLYLILFLPPQPLSGTSVRNNHSSRDYQSPLYNSLVNCIPPRLILSKVYMKKFTPLSPQHIKVALFFPKNLIFGKKNSPKNLFLQNQQLSTQQEKQHIQNLAKIWVQFTDVWMAI